MSAPANLPLLAREVARLLRAAKEIAGDYRADPQGYHQRHRAEMDGLARLLTEKHGARITEKYDGARVRLAGLTAHSTSGLAGALNNWLKQAREKKNG